MSGAAVSGSVESSAGAPAGTPEEGDEEMTDHNVIAVAFPERAKAFEALSELKGAGLEGRVDVIAATVVARDERGRVELPEDIDLTAGERSWGGGLIGLLVGVIGGPIGMLFGWSSGVLIGGALDVRRADRTSSVLGEISTHVPTGGTAVVAEVDEYTPEVIDTEMAKLGGVVYRRSADAVLADLEAAEEAYRAAEKEADRQAREQRKAERKEDFDQRMAALKEKLGIQ
jgi:uncharacterized membrane protein